MRILSLTILLLSFLTFKAQDSIQWMNFEEVQLAVKENPKPILIKVETPWCGYCKKMDAKVFTHKKFVKEYKDKYYFVKFNAEGKKDIVFNGKTYHYTMYSARSGVHQLAKYLAEENGRLSYPILVVLNPDLSINKKIVGYLERLNFMMWLDSEE